MSYRQSSTLILHTCNSFIPFFHTYNLYSVLSHLQSLFRSFTLTIFIPFVHTYNRYSVLSHLQFHYSIISHLQSLFHSYHTPQHALKFVMNCWFLDVYSIYWWIKSMTRSLWHVTTHKTTQCCVFIFLL